MARGGKCAPAPAPRATNENGKLPRSRQFSVFPFVKWSSTRT